MRTPAGNVRCDVISTGDGAPLPRGAHEGLAEPTATLAAHRELVNRSTAEAGGD